MENMPSNYYRFLNLSTIFFDQDLLTQTISKNLNKFKNNHWDHLDSIIYDSGIDFFSKFDYKIINAELFYTAPNSSIVWHTDMNPPEDFMKINFVWGSDKHLMTWGELKDSNKNYSTSKTKVESQYIRLNADDIIKTESIQIDKPTIINSGKPHRVLNFDERGRWCLSLIIMKDNKRILFKDAINALNEYVVN